MLSWRLQDIRSKIEDMLDTRKNVAIIHLFRQVKSHLPLADRWLFIMVRFQLPSDVLASCAKKQPSSCELMTPTACKYA